MIKYHDKPEELKFYSLEMNSYHSQLKQEKKHFDEKFILWTNKVSNNHGFSLSRAFSLIVCLTILFYYSEKILLGYTHLDHQFILKDIANLFLLINPLHSLNDIFPNIMKNTYPCIDLVKLLDVIHRILMSYLLFQFLKAFRKFVEK